MVKIIEKSSDQIAREERESKLVKIAKEIFGEKFYILNDNIRRDIRLLKKSESYENDTPIIVSFDDDRIIVLNSNYLEGAIKLAKAYEASGEPEFTVKKY